MRGCYGLRFMTMTLAAMLMFVLIAAAVVAVNVVDWHRRALMTAQARRVEDEAIRAWSIEI